MKYSKVNKIIFFAEWIFIQAKELNKKLSFKDALSYAISVLDTDIALDENKSHLTKNYFTHDTFKQITERPWEVACNEIYNSLPNEKNELFYTNSNKRRLQTEFLIKNYVFNEVTINSISLSTPENSYAINSQIIRDIHSYGFNLYEPIDTLMFFEKDGHILFSSDIDRQNEILKKGYKYANMRDISEYKKDNLKLQKDRVKLK